MIRTTLILIVIGLFSTALGLYFAPRQTLFSYLTAHAFVLSIALGALVLLMIGHVTSATWIVVLRRVPETLSAHFGLLALLFIPVLVGLHEIYSWTSFSGEPLLAAQKRMYLTAPFFTARAVFYFGSWMLAHRMVRTRPRLSAPLLPLVGLTLTFAAFDWLMSLSPTWFSTVFGLYVFAGGFLGAIASTIVVVYALDRKNRLPVTTEHYHALGRLLFAFTIFWAYIAFAQGFLIYIANKPDEVPWVAVRVHGSWQAVFVLLIVGHFVVPFALLLSRDLKRAPKALTCVAAWTVVMHYVDVYWLVLPTLHPVGASPHWLDVGTLALLVGLALLFGRRNLFRTGLVPEDDPRLAASLAYQST